MAKDAELDAPDEEYTAEEDVYKEEGRDELVEDDEISPVEEGFMQGAEDDGQRAKCAGCGKMLTPKITIEKEYGGELKWFCSEHCVEKYEEKQKEEEEV